MSGRSALCALGKFLFVAACASQPVVAQAPAPPPAPQPVPSKAEATQLFQSAVASHLEAEKRGTDSEALLRKAAEGYRRVLELRPGAVSALYNLGRAQQQLGDLESAGRSFALAAAQPGPDQPFYLRQSADFFAGRGRWREAAEAYEKLVLLDPRLEEPHAILRDHWLSQRETNSPGLLDYLWKLVGAGQGARAADLALSALERGWPSHLEPELLAATAVALAQSPRSPAETLRSPEIQRLSALRRLDAIRPGIDELLGLFTAPGAYPAPFRWWSVPYDEWAEYRGVSRREAFRSVMRAIGDWHGSRGELGISNACYQAAIRLVNDPDPVTLRRLASSYVEQGNLAAVDALAAEYADPAGALFQAKNRAYLEGKLATILDYHRALGQIYGAIASSGRADWGDTSTPTTALFQLDRAYSTAKALDRESGSAAKATHVDPDLTALLIQGHESKAAKLEAAGSTALAARHRARAIDVRVEAASKFDAGGDRRAVDKVLDGVRVDELAPVDRKRIEVYRKIPQESPAPKLVPNAQKLDARKELSPSVVVEDP